MHFSRVLGCGLQSYVLIKKLFYQRQFLQIFGDKTIPAKRLQQIPILVAICNISKTRFVHKRPPIRKGSMFKYIFSSSTIHTISSDKHLAALICTLMFDLQMKPKILILFGVVHTNNLKSLIRTLLFLYLEMSFLSRLILKMFFLCIHIKFRIQHKKKFAFIFHVYQIVFKMKLFLFEACCLTR